MNCENGTALTLQGTTPGSVVTIQTIGSSIANITGSIYVTGNAQVNTLSSLTTATITGALTAASATITGALTAAMTSITGTLTAGTISTLQLQSTTSNPIFNGITYHASVQPDVNYLTSNSVLPNMDSNTCICNYQFTTSYHGFLFGPVSDGTYVVSISDSLYTNTINNAVIICHPVNIINPSSTQQVGFVTVGNTLAWVNTNQTIIHKSISTGITTAGWYLSIYSSVAYASYVNNTLKISKIN